MKHMTKRLWRGPVRMIGSVRRQAGATLIEVLIAVLIMAIGLLGVAAIQAVALRNSQASVERTQAVIQSYSILDAMRSNVTAARSGAYNLPKACTSPSPGTRAQSDLKFWVDSLKATVGQAACGSVQCDVTSAVCIVTVFWDESRATAGTESMNVVTTSRL
ncbi:type IV pilus modification protein PilV [Luteimonas granuli]|nr:type IV pilus modification protein PilV [Luteimonas granuli]